MVPASFTEERLIQSLVDDNHLSDITVLLLFDTVPTYSSKWPFRAHIGCPIVGQNCGNSSTGSEDLTGTAWTRPVVSSPGPGSVQMHGAKNSPVVSLLISENAGFSVQTSKLGFKPLSQANEIIQEDPYGDASPVHV